MYPLSNLNEILNSNMDSAWLSFSSEESLLFDELFQPVSSSFLFRIAHQLKYFY